MPNSEQEMRERARKAWTDWKHAPFDDRSEFQVILDFALLERAEARREMICELVDLGLGEVTGYASGSSGNTRFKAYAISGYVKDALRAKLTPAPEAEKGKL